jgi:hypothetical protein
VQFIWQPKSTGDQVAGVTGGTAAAAAPAAVPAATAPAAKR